MYHMTVPPLDQPAVGIRSQRHTSKPVPESARRPYSARRIVRIYKRLHTLVPRIMSLPLTLCRYWVSPRIPHHGTVLVAAGRHKRR